MPAVAQTSASEVSQSKQQSYSFNIAAKPLPQAIADLSAVTGLQVLYTEQATFNRTAPALSGTYTAYDALEYLLAGSGLVMRVTSENSVTIEKQSGDVTTLPAVKISSSLLSSTTEETQSYTIAETNTATKLKLTPRQTPQIINSVTHQMIEDFAAQDMEDVLSLVPGISTGHADDDRRTYTARGYSMAVQYDGLPSTSGIDGGVVAGPDSALIDHTDVLLGAAGLMNGAGQPGGVINMVYKRPTDVFQGSASISAGSWDQQRLVVDLSGPLNESGRLRGRMISVDQSEESFRDFEKERKKVFYAVVEGDLSDSTLVSFSIHNQDIYDNVTDRSGLPADNNGKDLDWSQSTFLAPDWNHWNKYATTYKARLEQQLPANWQLTVQASQLTSEADWLFATLSDFDSVSGDATFSRWAQQNKETSDDYEFFLSGPIRLFERDHEIVIGGNWTERVWARSSGDGTDYETNLYNFDPRTSIPRPEVALIPSKDDQITGQYGSYIAGHFKITDALNAILGSRISWYSYEFGATSRDENAEITPYLGLTYELNNWASAYFSYSDIFNPQSSKGTDGNTLEPELGSNYELGLKGEFYNGKLNASIALFNIIKDNEAEIISSIPPDLTNICGGWCYAPKGETKTKGFDLGLSGQITPEIQIMAGFTQYEKDDNNETVNIAKLSTSYSPKGQNWSIGGNVDSSSKSYTQWGMVQEARTLVGVFGKYQINPQINIALNIHNLLDEEYYANAIDSGYGRQYWGEPRSWSITAHSVW
ncbi:Ferripyoverdine receptor [Zhongshania aliphaticivorans]|nr:Ferripyoverdine receptor [Zhongshania aliphaticivorans]